MKLPKDIDYTDDEWGDPYGHESPYSVRCAIRKTLWSYHGTRYTFGGDDPILGTDCTGLISIGLRVIGMLGKRERLATGSLWETYGKCRLDQYHAPRPLDIVCFFKNKDDAKPCHAEWYWAPRITYGASGGTSETDTPEEAAERNAFVQCSPLEGRFPYWEFLRVFGPWGPEGPPE